MGKKSKDNKMSIDPKSSRMDILDKIGKKMYNIHEQALFSYDEFVYLLSIKPKMILRDIFQYFYDMVFYYVPEGIDEYSVTSESIGFLKYDMHNLFISGCAEPFYADRIFANRFMSLICSFRKGIQNNQIYLFEGPVGSGKSTFLNNLITKLENYSVKPEGAMYKIAWELDITELPGYLISPQHSEKADINQKKDNKLLISCPNNDHPITIFPKHLRKELLSSVIEDKKVYKEISDNKDYEWVFNKEACAFCNLMFNHLSGIYKNPLSALRKVHPRRIEFNRHFGRVVSIFNPGDPLLEGTIENKELQHNINKLFSTDELPYLHSYLAYTNNGVLALMDIKENNKTRLMNLHGIISDGVRKVNHIEEKISSLFLGVINPEDTVVYTNVQSFVDRVVTIKIPYVLDYNTEVNIWKHKFGSHVANAFMPRVLKNFSKIIISTRMNTNTDTFDDWLAQSAKYKNYVDKNLFLLKMELYVGNIPRWLEERDIQNFKKEIRKRVISATENEGYNGISGRQSLNIFNKFISKYELGIQNIIMPNIMDFVSNEPFLKNVVSEEFTKTLYNLYEFNILDEVKESLYFYNEAKMKRDIKNYLFALNFEPGEKVFSPETGDTLELNDDFYNSVEPFIFGESNIENIKELRKQEHLTYVTQTLTKEIKLKNIPVEQTEQFLHLFGKYTDNLKKSTLVPYENNVHFKSCIETHNTPAFNKFENTLKKRVARLFENMCKKFGYTETSAQYIILYVLDNNLNQRFKDFGIK